MRPYQIFAAMAPERASEFFRTIADESPEMFAHALSAAGAALKSRPAYLRKLPFERQAGSVRRALARVAADAVAEEMLAVYFLECRKALLAEWLDTLGIDHDGGRLKEDAPESPADGVLEKAVAEFRGKEENPDRELLLLAFAAQASIEWPALDALLDPA